MAKLTRIIVRTSTVLFILIPMAAFAHYLVFPEETRSMLIAYSGAEKRGRIYFSASAVPPEIDALQSLITQASIRVDSFWGQKTCNPRFIYCDNEAAFQKYCVSASAPAVTYLKLGSVIVLSKSGVDIDIIAHEISHAELYERIGFYAFNFKIPSWFKHGLAMQCDGRNYYSEDTLKVKSNNFRHLPAIRNFKTDRQFYAGPLEQVMFHYMAARHEVRNWYTREKMEKLIKDLNAGKSFTDAFGQ